MTPLLTLLDRFENAAGVYERSDDKADRDELHAARRAIMEAFAGMALHGPYGWLIMPEGLSEEHWHLSNDPEPGTPSEPLFAKREQVLGDAPQPAPVEVWQPIETAPKDGTEVILYGPPCVYEGKEYPERVTSGAWIEWADTEECDGGASWMSWDGGFRAEEPPTKWQPLPKPSGATLISPSTEREAELVKALEPFAKVGRIIDGPFGPALFANDDDAFQSGCAWTEDGERKTLTWGNFRAARAAIHPSLEQE